MREISHFILFFLSISLFVCRDKSSFNIWVELKLFHFRMLSAFLGYADKRTSCAFSFEWKNWWFNLKISFQLAGYSVGCRVISDGTKSVTLIICWSARKLFLHLNIWTNAILANQNVWRMIVCATSLLRSFGHLPLTLFLFPIVLLFFRRLLLMCAECQLSVNIFCSCDNVSFYLLWMKEKGAAKEIGNENEWVK